MCAAWHLYLLFGHQMNHCYCCGCPHCGPSSIATAIAANNCTPADCWPSSADEDDRAENERRLVSVNGCRVSIFPSNLDCHGTVSAEVRWIRDSRPMWLFAKMCYRQMLCKMNERKREEKKTKWSVKFQFVRGACAHGESEGDTEKLIKTVCAFLFGVVVILSNKMVLALPACIWSHRRRRAHPPIFRSAMRVHKSNSRSDATAHNNRKCIIIHSTEMCRCVFVVYCITMRHTSCSGEGSSSSRAAHNALCILRSVFFVNYAQSKRDVPQHLSHSSSYDKTNCQRSIHRMRTAIGGGSSANGHLA